MKRYFKYINEGFDFSQAQIECEDVDIITNSSIVIREYNESQISPIQLMNALWGITGLEKFTNKKNFNRNNFYLYYNPKFYNADTMHYLPRKVGDCMSYSTFSLIRNKFKHYCLDSYYLTDADNKIKKENPAVYSVINELCNEGLLQNLDNFFYNIYVSPDNGVVYIRYISNTVGQTEWNVGYKTDITVLHGIFYTGLVKYTVTEQMTNDVDTNIDKAKICKIMSSIIRSNGHRINVGNLPDYTGIEDTNILYTQETHNYIRHIGLYNNYLGDNWHKRIAFRSDNKFAQQNTTLYNDVVKIATSANDAEINPKIFSNKTIQNYYFGHVFTNTPYNDIDTFEIKKINNKMIVASPTTPIKSTPLYKIVISTSLDMVEQIFGKDVREYIKDYGTIPFKITKDDKLISTGDNRIYYSFLWFTDAGTEIINRYVNGKFSIAALKKDWWNKLK